jgi:hypothetical protein
MYIIVVVVIFVPHILGSTSRIVMRLGYLGVWLQRLEKQDTSASKTGDSLRRFSSRPVMNPPGNAAKEASHVSSFRIAETYIFISPSSSLSISELLLLLLLLLPAAANANDD